MSGQPLLSSSQPSRFRHTYEIEHDDVSDEDEELEQCRPKKKAKLDPVSESIRSIGTGLESIARSWGQRDSAPNPPLLNEIATALKENNERLQEMQNTSNIVNAELLTFLRKFNVNNG